MRPGGTKYGGINTFSFGKLSAFTTKVDDAEGRSSSLPKVMRSFKPVDCTLFDSAFALWDDSEGHVPSAAWTVAYMVQMIWKFCCFALSRFVKDLRPGSPSGGDESQR